VVLCGSLQPNMPPRIDVAVLDFGKYTASPHDPGGALLKLGLEGSECLMKALSAEGEERRRLLERCLELRLREREGWLAVRTAEHPAGDRRGAAKAASSISTSHIKMFNIEQAREWSLRAMAECPVEAKVLRESIEHNLGVIDNVAKILHVDRRVRVHGLAKSPQYNGFCGRVLSHDGPRWQVLLDAEAGGQQRLLMLRPQNVTLL
jgi:hypothetical protein